MKEIEGGVTAAKGFKAAGVHAGIRPGKTKKDLGLIYCDVKCAAAGLFTTNLVKADPVLLDIETLKDPYAQAIIANSGIANACAPNGMKHAREMQKITADAMGIDADLVLTGSTGVIGMELFTECIADHIDELKKELVSDPSGSDACARAIMTTDTVKKEYALEAMIGGKPVRIGGISKGSGMIHPNMGTMLAYITTDCAIAPSLLKKALKEACAQSFNRISVDGDTSTNDSLIILASGLAENPRIEEAGEDYQVFRALLSTLCVNLARKMAKDGEGAKHLITCSISHARSVSEAEQLAKSVIGSSLTKAAIFGCDANWGRVLCALGYAGVEFDPAKTDIRFASSAGRIEVARSGRGLAFDEELAKKILSEDEVVIEIDLHDGESEVTCWGCDLTYDYVKINGDYKT